MVRTVGKTSLQIRLASTTSMDDIFPQGRSQDVPILMLAVSIIGTLDMLHPSLRSASTLILYTPPKPSEETGGISYSRVRLLAVKDPLKLSPPPLAGRHRIPPNLSDVKGDPIISHCPSPPQLLASVVRMRMRAELNPSTERS